MCYGLIYHPNCTKKAYNDLLKKYPEYVSAYFTYVKFLRDKKMTYEAFEILIKARKKFPKNTQILQTYAIFVSQEYEIFDTSLKCVKEAITLTPETETERLVNLYIALGIEYSGVGKEQEAYSAFKKAEEYDPHYSAWLKLSIHLVSLI